MDETELAALEFFFRPMSSPVVIDRQRSHYFGDHQHLGHLMMMPEAGIEPALLDQHRVNLAMRDCT